MLYCAVMLLRKIRKSIHNRGFLGTISLASKRLFEYLNEKQFDRKLGIDTSGRIKPAGESELSQQSAGYQGTVPEVFKVILDKLSIDPREFAFVDLGCGKGRTLILAAHRSFKAVIGVEYDQELAQIAEMNLRKQGYLSPGTLNAVICGDASEYLLPDEHVVIYLFNPFKSDIMRRVLDNICAPSSKERYIIYYNPVVNELFDQSPYLELLVSGPTIPGRSPCAIYKVRPNGSTRESS
jgi:SAM-dependent methyltransferase